MKIIVNGNKVYWFVKIKRNIFICYIFYMWIGIIYIYEIQVN